MAPPSDADVRLRPPLRRFHQPCGLDCSFMRARDTRFEPVW
jgi:hypothetical protein